jgi:hypothetical protein
MQFPIIPAPKIFVFGSNEAGHHGLGAAKDAVKHYGAVYGVGFGPQGRSFAIPTKDWLIEPLPIEVVRGYVARFIEYATQWPQKQFFVTKVGCGLAGFTEGEIAPLFANAPANCELPDGWREVTPSPPLGTLTEPLRGW